MPSFLSLSRVFLDDVEKENLDVKKEEILSNLLGQLKTNLPAYQASLGQVRASEKSSTITEADQLRDEDFQRTARSN